MVSSIQYTLYGVHRVAVALNQMHQHYKDLVSRTQRGGRVVYRELFSLKTMLEFLSHAVERHFPVITAVYLPSLE
jgi:hypothetical protein